MHRAPRPDIARIETNLRGLYEKTPAALYSVDAEGRLLTVSDRWLEMLGYRREETIGHLAFDFLAPASREHAYQVTLKNFLATGRIDAEPLQFMTRSGAVIDVLLSVVLENKDADVPPRYIGVLEDVTPRHRAEQALAEERRRLMSIIAGTQTGTWEWNVQTGELRLNEQWANILGYTLAELQPLSLDTFLERVHPDDKGEVAGHLRKRLTGDFAYVEYEARLRHRDGHWVPTLVRGGVTSRTADDRTEWVYGTLQDHSALKAQEEALRKSQSFLERIEHQAGVGGWEFDLASDTVRWSDQLCRIAKVACGYAPSFEEASRFVAPEARPKFQEAIEQGKRDGLEWSLEVPFVRADGERIWVLATGRCEYAQGALARLLGTIQDVTAQKEQEAALRKSQMLLAQTGQLAGVGGWDYDLASGAFHFSNEACHIYGIEPGSMLTMEDNVSLYAPEVQASIRETVDKAIREGSHWDVELPVTRTDGKRIWVRARGKVEMDDGMPARLVGAVQDVTELVEQRRAIEETRDRMTLATDAGQIGIWEYQPDIHVFTMDVWMRRLHGLADDEAQRSFQQLLEEFVHPDDREDCRLSFVNALTHERRIDLAYRIIRRDGGLRHLRSVAQMTRNDTGKILRVVGAVWDVTAQKEQEAALRKSQSFLDRTGRMAGVGGWELDLRSKTVFWSDETCRLHGIAPGFHGSIDEAVRFYSEAGRDLLKTKVAQTGHELPGWEVELPIVRADGHAAWIRAVSTVEFEDGEPARLVGAVQDVTEQRENAEAMRRTLALQTAIFDSAEFSIISTDPRGVITMFNRAAQRMLGYSEAEMVGVATPERFHDRDEIAARAAELTQELGRPIAPGIDTLIASTLNDGGKQREWTYVRRDGSRFPALLSVTALRDDQGNITGFLSTGADISARKEAEIKLLHLANYDSLTGLANRSSLRQAADHLIPAAKRRGEMLAIVFLDLDRFKEVNDTLGHETGDKLLQLVAIRLKACVRETDVVARMGGDEFVVLLPGIGTADEVSIITDKIQQRFTHPVRLSGHEICIGTSMGVSLFPGDGEDAMRLFRCADSALYQAKAEGRNNMQFYRPELTSRAEDKLHTLSSLRRALAQREFQLHYQPIFSLRDGAVVGAEALLHWQHPTRGLLPPDVFIAIAEDSGLIVPIGEWAIAEACRAAASMGEVNDHNFSMSVNVSARQFKSDQLVQTVQQALDDTGLAPSRLCLEITEQLLLGDTERNMEQIRALKKLGVRIAIDDFGTGYSSLAYIKRFNPDIIKIDRSFVTDVADNPDDAAIVDAILAMGKSLHITIVAEGVETAAQHDFLLQRECDMVQGYWYSRPVAYAAWKDWMSTHNA